MILSARKILLKCNQKYFLFPFFFHLFIFHSRPPFWFKRERRRKGYKRPPAKRAPGLKRVDVPPPRRDPSPPQPIYDRYENRRLFCGEVIGRIAAAANAREQKVGSYLYWVWAGFVFFLTGCRISSRIIRNAW